MIDVVFLLLVFFMLAARFGIESAVPTGAALAGGETYRGAPRLITLTPEVVRLNGVAVVPADLVDRLRPLMPDADALVVLRPSEGVELQAVIALLDRLSAAGVRRVVLAK